MKNINIVKILSAIYLTKGGLDTSKDTCTGCYSVDNKSLKEISNDIEWIDLEDDFLYDILNIEKNEVDLNYIIPEGTMTQWDNNRYLYDFEREEGGSVYIILNKEIFFISAGSDEIETLEIDEVSKDFLEQKIKENISNYKIELENLDNLFN